MLNRNTHQSPSSSKLKLSIQQSLNVDSNDEIENDNYDEHRLSIDDSEEQNRTIFENDDHISDDEQVRRSKICWKLLPAYTNFERGRMFAINKSSENVRVQRKKNVLFNLGMHQFQLTGYQF